MEKLIIVILISATVIVLTDMLGNMAFANSTRNAQKIEKLEKKIVELENRIKILEIKEKSK